MGALLAILQIFWLFLLDCFHLLLSWAQASVTTFGNWGYVLNGIVAVTVTGWLLSRFFALLNRFTPYKVSPPPTPSVRRGPRPVSGPRRDGSTIKFAPREKPMRGRDVLGKILSAACHRSGLLIKENGFLVVRLHLSRAAKEAEAEARRLQQKIERAQANAKRAGKDYPDDPAWWKAHPVEFEEMATWTPKPAPFHTEDNRWPDRHDSLFSDDDFAVNPATGCPMVGGTGGVDTMGNPYGCNFND